MYLGLIFFIKLFSRDAGRNIISYENREKVEELEKIENSKKNIVKYSQEEIITDKSKIFEEVFNVSLFQDKKIFIITNVSDKILNIIEEIIKKI